MNDVPDNLARAVEALDRDAARVSVRVDPARVAEAVLRRLREEPELSPVPRRRGGFGVLRVAAAIAVLVAAGAIGQRLWRGPATPSATGLAVVPVTVAPDSVSAVQAGQLLAAVDEVRRADSVTVVRTVFMEDLDETELRTLLRQMSSEE